MVPSSPKRSVLLPVRLGIVAAAIALAGTTVPTQTPPTPPWGIYDLGTLGGAASTAQDAGDFAQVVVGQAQTTNGAFHAFIDGLAGRRDLGTLGGASSVAFSVYGAIVGQSQTATGQTHAFLYDNPFGLNSRMVDLGTLGGTFSAAYGVEGVVVGASRIAGDARIDAFQYLNGVMSPLAATRGGDSVARAIKGGVIVGYSCTAGNASCRAVQFANGVATTLFTLGGNSVANSLNFNGQIAGTSALADPTVKHAVFLVAPGQLPTDLGTLGGRNSEAFDINDRGHVVGTSDTASSGPHAFWWDGTTMMDLNAFLPAGSGWVLQSATGISEGGQIVGTGTHNGAMRGFILTPPTDLQLFPGGARSQADGNLPRGVEAGNEIRFVSSVVSFVDTGRTIYGSKVTFTLTGPGVYSSIRGYDNNAPECRLTAKVITCDAPPVDTIGFGPEYFVRVRTTGAGAISHSAVLTSTTPDPNSSNNAYTENNRAVSLSALALTPATVAGGKASSARVTLNDLPPGGDALVRLVSSRPDIAPVPATVNVPAHSNSPSRAFNIIPKVVSAPTAVEITATYGLVSVRQTLTVVPPALAQLYLTPTTIVGGCGTSAGKIALTGAAPAGGAVIPLSNTNASAVAPASVTVPAGATTQTFTVTTKYVTTNVAGSVGASYGGVSKNLAVTVRPIRVKTLTVTPNPVTGGSTASGSFALECAAPAGGIVVALSSSNGALAVPAAASVTLPAGATGGSFSVRTTRPAVSTAATVYAATFGVRKGAALTVLP